MDRYGFVNTVKKEWKNLWNEKFSDREKAESIALKDYPVLFVDKGVVIGVSSGCCIDGVEKVIRRHEVELGERLLSPPNPDIGGYGKFIREVIKKQQRDRYGILKKKVADKPSKPKRGGPLKKGGRGILHQI